jgi:tetratricopeptide (TPR) repeat protein
MTKPNWAKLEFEEGVLREPTPDDSQLILWLRGDLVDGFQHWERIGNVVGAEVTLDQGLFRSPATVIRARQKLHGFFGKLFQLLRKSQGNRTWLLPNGAIAEQVGERANDRMLLWADDETGALDEQDVGERCGRDWQIRKIGMHCFIATRVEVAEELANADAGLPEIKPLEQAKQLLDAARNAGDCHKQGLPLVDLGIICVQNGKIPQAIELLQRAVAIARKYEDRPLESDAQTNLATALLAAGRPEKAKELLEIELARARVLADRFQEKLVLGHLAAVNAKLRDHEQAILIYQQALAVARELGDERHEADLLWQLAVQHAEIGQRNLAITDGQAAIDRLRNTDNPKAPAFAEALEKYILASAGNQLQVPDAAQEQGPGLLRMAVSAAKSLVNFAGSGLKVVSRDIYLKRLDACGRCANHTGVRCKLCGCFTSMKARLPHERCPLAMW